MATTRAIRKDEVDLWAQRMGQYIEDNSSANPLTSPDWCFVVGFYYNSTVSNKMSLNCDGEEVTVSRLASNTGMIYNTQTYVVIQKAGITLPNFINIIELGSSFDTSGLAEQGYSTTTNSFYKGTKFWYYCYQGGSKATMAVLGAGSKTNSGYYKDITFGGIKNYFGIQYSSSKYNGIIYPYGLSFSTTVPSQSSDSTPNLYYYDRYRYTSIGNSNYKIAGSRSAYPTGSDYTKYLGQGAVTSTLRDEMAQQNISDAQLVTLFAQIKTAVSQTLSWNITIQNPFKGCKQIIITL